MQVESLDFDYVPCRLKIEEEDCDDGEDYTLNCLRSTTSHLFVVSYAFSQHEEMINLLPTQPRPKPAKQKPFTPKKTSGINLVSAKDLNQKVEKTIVLPLHVKGK